jgi:hypothetical protein
MPEMFGLLGPIGHVRSAGTHTEMTERIPNPVYAHIPEIATNARREPPAPTEQ